MATSDNWIIDNWPQFVTDFNGMRVKFHPMKHNYKMSTAFENVVRSRFYHIFILPTKVAFAAGQAINATKNLNHMKNGNEKQLLNSLYHTSSKRMQIRLVRRRVGQRSNATRIYKQSDHIVSSISRIRCFFSKRAVFFAYLFIKFANVVDDRIGAKLSTRCNVFSKYMNGRTYDVRVFVCLMNCVHIEENSGFYFSLSRDQTTWSLYLYEVAQLE